jgi:RND family efflux transporter MFP subunit
MPSLALAFKKLRLLALAGLLLIPAAVAQSASKPALAVTLTQAQQTMLPMRIFANGNVAAWQEAIIGSEVNGLRLSQVLVNVGDVVKAGQLLAVFSAESIRADLNQAQASVLEAAALSKEALGNAKRARSLQNTGAMSNQQIEQYVTAADTAQARLEVAQAMLDNQKIRLKNSRIYAPDAGVISARNATVGAVTAAGSELFRLIRQGRLEWRAEVTSADLARIKIGMPVKVTVADATMVSGKVRMLAPTVDMQSRNSLIYVDLPASSSAKAGMFANGEFVLGQSSAMTLPQQALVLRDGFSYVFAVSTSPASNTVQAKTTVRQVKVQTGRRIGNLVEIISGLALQQPVVASGGAFLSDHDVVKVISGPSLKNTTPTK